MKKIGILGGTFNPIHEGHLNIARCARDFLSLDEVWFLPAGTPPHKDVAEHVSAWHRKNMVNAAIASERAFLLCDIELEKKTPCYSWETLEELHAQYGQKMHFLFYHWRRFFCHVRSIDCIRSASVPSVKLSSPNVHWIRLLSKKPIQWHLTSV